MLKKELQKMGSGLKIYITKKEAKIHKLKAGSIVTLTKNGNKKK